jgi:competence protein ComEA
VVYRRRELWLLLLLAVSLGVGLAVREFRAGFPDLANRLEELDHEEPAPSAGSTRSVPSPSKIQGSHDSRLDLNRATAEELQRLPGIGPTLAAQIVRTRERRGRFSSAEDLRTVAGIGPKKFDAIRDLVTVTEGPAGDGAP